MNSPELDLLPLDNSHHISVSKDILRDDSGYVTVTPRSAECTGLSTDSSLVRLPRRSALETGTPREPPRPRPKHLRDAFNDSSIDRSYSFDSELGEIKEIRSGELSILREIPIENVQVGLKSKSLKRQNATTDEHYYPCASGISPVCGNHNSVTQVLQNLAVSEHHVPPKRKRNACSVFKSSSSDPSDYKYVTCTPSTSPQGRAHTPPPSGEASCVSCPITPIKHKRTAQRDRTSPDHSYPKHLNRSPLNEDYSPIFKTDNQFSERKSSYRSQKLGTPEKNKMLYPHLREVTPPKKIKTPEKVRKDAPKARKSLSYSGIKHIDFLKLLGIEQNLWIPVRKIFKMLTDKDLHNVCRVSRMWQEVCRKEPQAEARRHRSAQRLERVKENRPAVQPAPLKGNSTRTFRRRLIEIQNHSNMPLRAPPKPVSPPVSPGKRRFNSFVKAASEDSDVQLCICPRCRGPAQKRGPWAMCKATECGNTFCISCSSELCPEHHCSRPVEAPSPSKQHSGNRVGSEKSRRYLRRL